jgi:predicted DNA-binding transcriptional regulator AlpA
MLKKPDSKEQSTKRPKVRKPAIATYCGGVTPRTIDNWREQHSFPSISVGRVVLFDLDAVDVWLEQFATTSPETQA